MTTILVLNAVSGLLATIGIGGFLLWRGRHPRPNVIAQPVYLTRTDPPARGR
ncbi:MAG: hypothetical protein ACLP50_18880 [Solirubrobacteraceae bacterium]